MGFWYKEKNQTGTEEKTILLFRSIHSYWLQKLAMAVLEAALSILSFSSSSSSKPHLFSRQTKPTSLSIQIPSNLTSVFPLSTPLRAGGDNNSRRLVSVCSSVTEEEASPPTEETQKENLKRKLFVFNLPWSMSVNDISQLFGQCGTVFSVEVLVSIS